MRFETEEHVDQWWRDLFGLHPHELWKRVTVQHPHGLLGDYPGWYVAWRGGGVHVSAPSSAAASEVASLREAAGPDLQNPQFWQGFAQQRGMDLLGPSTHHLLDDDPGPVDGVIAVDPAEVATMRAKVSASDWDESGLSHANSVAFGMVEHGELVATAGLDQWDGAPRDVGVLVIPAARGRGCATRVGGHAASYAIREHRVARWRALTTNLASTRAATRLGFEAYCTQLAMRASGIDP